MGLTQIVRSGQIAYILSMATDTWKQILLTLEKSLNPGLFTVWIKPLQAEVKGHTLTLYAPNEFVCSWVRDRLTEPIRDAAAQTMGSRPDLRILVRKQATPVAPKVPEGLPVPAVPRAAAQQMGLPIVQVPRATRMHNWRFSFEDFVVGPCNELACAASRSMCSSGAFSGHLFLSSGHGLGKTHLLHAIGQRLTRESNKCSLNVLSLTAEEFATRLVLALKSRQMDRFKNEFRDAADVLLLEDVHFFQGKEKMQDELDGTLRALEARGCKVVLTSSFLPRELEKIDSGLVSQFTSGFLAVIDQPDFETRRRIVTRKARALQVVVPDDVSELLAERITSDVRQLESCLNNLVLKARLLNRQVSLDMAWDVLANYTLAAAAAPDIDRIIEFVCRSFELTREQLRSKSRKQHIVQARNTAFYLARKHTEMSLQAIGDRLCRKHSTVIKGITNVEREISKQTPQGRQFERVVSRLTA